MPKNKQADSILNQKFYLIHLEIFNLIYTFKDTLVYEKYARGRSSTLIVFKSTIDQKEYPMFLSEFDYMMKERGFKNKDKVSGYFCFCKQYSNFSLKYLSFSKRIYVRQNLDL